MLQEFGDIALERTEDLCFVDSVTMKQYYVCHCCSAVSTTKVKPVPGLKTKNGVMSAERRAISKLF